MHPRPSLFNVIHPRPKVNPAVIPLGVARLDSPKKMHENAHLPFAQTFRFTQLASWSELGRVRAMLGDGKHGNWILS